MLKKERCIRLHGAKLKELNNSIFERDKHCCIICGTWVADGVKFHHEPCGTGKKSDEITKGVVLCGNCHYERHFGKKQKRIKTMIINYLKNTTEKKQC